MKKTQENQPIFAIFIVFFTGVTHSSHLKLPLLLLLPMLYTKKKKNQHNVKGNLISCYLQQQQQQIIAIKINNNNNTNNKKKNSIKLVNMSTKPYKKQKTSPVLLKRTCKARRRERERGGGW